jgi:hypothetical protein
MRSKKSWPAPNGRICSIAIGLGASAGRPSHSLAAAPLADSWVESGCTVSLMFSS